MTQSPIIANVGDELLRGVLLVASGMSGVKDIDDATIIIMCKNLKRYYSSFAANELLLAFELNVNGQLDERHEAYGVFDNNYVSKILDSYRFKRMEARKELERNKPTSLEALPPTDEELYNGLMKFAEFPEYYNWSAVFKHLEKIGEIKMSLDEKKSQYAEVYSSMVNRMSLTDRANLDELEFKDMVAQECRKIAVRRWYELNKTT